MILYTLWGYIESYQIYYILSNVLLISLTNLLEQVILPTTYALFMDIDYIMLSLYNLFS